MAPALALAYGASYAVGVAVSLVLLSRRLGGVAGTELGRFVVRVVLAAVPAAGAAWLAIWAMQSGGLDVSSKSDSLVILAVGGLVGMCGYLALARMLRIREISQMVSLIASRGRRG
ncbi:MAG: hypothetical protein WKF73_13635 [Nocardioidaceae bacterium]